VSALEDLGRRMMELEERLRPIAQRPVDITRPGWLQRLQSGSPPLDEAHVRQAAERLLADLIDVYEEGDEDTREAVRQLFARCRSFAWAAALPDSPTSEAGLWRCLILFSMKDLGPDSRDALLVLRKICRASAAAGVPLRPTLRAVAAMSSHVNKHGMGSARDMLLRQCPRP
jgi:AcrR family transcriptional regulator